MSDRARYRVADRIFDAALDLAGGERAVFLDRECGDDTDLRALVERLLRNAGELPTGELVTGGALSVPAEPAPDLSGTSLDRYRVTREIGRGGMGVVYEAHDDKLHRTVAIKVLRARGGDEGGRTRFLREARAAAALNHPNIVAIHDAGEADGRPYLVMEHVAGDSLETRPPASIAEAVTIARQVCDALDHAHGRGLVHRDLKPGNVLVAREGGRLVAKLTDMGIALARGAARVTQTGAVTGTPTFMAPEQALGKEVDGRADLYSLGVMLYAWAAGRPPFEGDDGLAVVSQHIHAPVVPPRRYRAELPAGLEPLILRLLAKDPASRFASAAEVAAALGAVGTDAAGPDLPAAMTIEGLTRGRMVGRRAELARLQELWRAAAQGGCHLALISGEPGIGKTRLAFELSATAQLDGAVVLGGGCYENEATTPYLPFLEAFRRVVRDCDDERLAALLGDSAAEIARLAPEIESRLGPFEDRGSLAPQEERLRLFDHVARFLVRLAAPGGLLFFIDDLQWADHGSLALLHYLLRQLSGKPVLFLGAYREVELDRAHALSRTLVDWNRERLATRVRLERLDRQTTVQLVTTLLGQREPSGEFAALLYEETEGNPFFVEEIVKALIAEGRLVHQGSSWERCSTDELVLPQSVKAAIGSRLERMSECGSEVLRTAAVLGKVFEFAELVSVARRPEDEVLDALDEAARAQLIAPGRGETFSFTHDKIREVLYDELNPIRRRRLHARIAKGLEALRERGTVVAVEDLAHHFVESGDLEKGLEYARRAADAAARVYAWDEALEMLARARECAEGLGRGDELARLDEAMGDVAWASGDVTGAAQIYERALAISGDSVRRNALRGKAGEMYATFGDPRGLEHVRAALAELDPGRRPRETAQAMMIEARYLHLRGELDRAAALYGEAARLAEPLGDSELLVRLNSYLSGTYQHLAELDDSEAAARRCIEIGERDGVPTGVLLGYEFLMEASFYRGRLEESIRWGEQEERLAREIHAGERLGWSHFRALALVEAGRLDEAERLCRRGIELCARTGDRRLELFLRMGVAACQTDSGRSSEGRALARDAVSEADEADLVSHRIVGRGYLIRALLADGRPAEAAGVAREAVELWKTSGSRGVFLIYGPDLAEGLVAGGVPDEARALLEAHEEIARGTASERRLAQNRRVRGML